MDLHWVDVFATGPLTGNPLAVITCNALPGAPRMQRVAAELGLSETVFAVPGDPPAVRIFTPEAEIPLAGHPMVGAAWVLRNIGWIGDAGVIRAPAGDVPVSADDHGADITIAGPRRVGTADAAALAGCLGARDADSAPVWHAGLPQAMLRVGDLDGLRPDHPAIRAQGLDEGWAGVSAYVLDEPGGAGPAVARVRHFAGPIGIPEDPVTGSAAGALGACLAAGGLTTGTGELRLLVRQGQHMGRPGEVRVRVSMQGANPTSVRVGGAVVPILTGAVRQELLAG